jgi:hypothetical protein
VYANGVSSSNIGSSRSGLKGRGVTSENYTMKRLQCALALALFACSVSTAGAEARAATAPRADAGLDHFPESADIRAAYWASFFTASEPDLLRRSPAVVSNEYGDFRLSVVKTGGYLYAVATALAAPLPAKGEPPVATQGSWVLKRSSPDGAPIQAKVFLRSDSGTFIRIYPDGDRSKLDLVVYGGVLNREVPLPVSFDRAFASTLADIESWTESLVDWSLFSPQSGLYREVRAFVDETRKRLPGLRYGDDGALDSSGQPVYIATGQPQEGDAGLNCSGFASWVADGFYRPMTGRLLDPAALSARHAASRATTSAERYEEELDPFFGLDWTRNIAAALLDARSSSRPHTLFESDVRISPFALVVDGTRAQAAVNGSSAYRSYPAYQLDLGYDAAGLKALLYVLAIREPGSIYFASVSGRNGNLVRGLNRHYHVAVLAPYFDESGQFKTACFESCAETSVEAMMARLKKDCVHLVRVVAERDYDPPAFPGR